MKKVGYLLFASALVALGGCSDDTFEQTGGTPAKVGDEITFGSSLNDVTVSSSSQGDVALRTVYSDRPVNGAYIVSWEEDGSDQIAIYCPEASNGTLVDYSVTPDAANPTHSSTVTKVNKEEAGLQWGNTDMHHFYGFYPASAVTGTENGRISGTVPTLQSPVSWNVEDNANGGQNYYGKTNTDLAFMWAYGECNRETMENKDVPLTFHPWMTVIEIKIPGPTEGTKYVTNVNVQAVGGQQTFLAGKFICDMTPVLKGTGDAPNYAPAENTGGTVNNTISISCYHDDGNPSTPNFFPMNSPNDTLIVRAYLLPIDDQNKVDARNIRINVATLNGAALTRTLGMSNVGPNSIQPHKVNTVVLPNLLTTGTNYWLSSLDRNVYLSEVSMPGSKFSYLTAANGANPVYQGATIQQQFLDGVRAFIVQCRADATYHATRTGSIWGGGYQYSYSYEDATLPIEGGNGQTLANTIEDIAAELETAENELGVDRNLECAVVMVTYSGGGGVNVDFSGNEEWGADVNTVGGADNVWMDAIQHELKDLSEKAANRIYTGEITPNTTLDDVKGKIILKVNYNTNEQASHMPADAGTPALFSMWDGTKNDVPLRWGSANPAVQTDLSWYYHEATHVGSNTEITWANKQSEVLSVLSESVTEYQNNAAHNIWFMVDAGGTYYYGRESNEEVIRLTHDLNPIVEEALQTRAQNASTGLVFFNFADKQENSGVHYGTNTLIQTIIDNNFKFNLRKKDSSSTTNTIGGGGSSMGDGGNAIQ